MNYQLTKDVIQLIEEFDTQVDSSLYSKDIAGFKSWLAASAGLAPSPREAIPVWEGKDLGRTMDSVISTLIVHLGRYAKTYAKSAIYDSDFSTQEDFIYLINLKAFGAMSKTDLIKRNIQDKPVGMQIINRLIKQDFVWQQDSLSDKRSKIIVISKAGLEALAERMDKIRQATTLVVGNLTDTEKTELIRLLQKLENFHQPIFNKNIDVALLLDTVYNELIFNKN